ncbi:MAG: 30S ribosomal protein S17e [Euryarchaeota archaeon]|nr:30S ribosomal protein S17e [Euryarchaeota archaeon]
MGKIRPTFIKRVAKEIFEKYPKKLDNNFYKNREFLKDKVEFPNSRIENRVVGYVTTLAKKT